MIGGFSGEFPIPGKHAERPTVDGGKAPVFLPHLAELGVNLTGLLAAGKPTAPTAAMRSIVKTVLIHTLSAMRVSRRQDGEPFKLPILRIFGLNPSSEEMGVLQNYTLYLLHAGLPMRSMM